MPVKPKSENRYQMMDKSRYHDRDALHILHKRRPFKMLHLVQPNTSAPVLLTESPAHMHVMRGRQVPSLSSEVVDYTTSLPITIPTKAQLLKELSEPPAWQCFIPSLRKELQLDLPECL